MKISSFSHYVIFFIRHNGKYCQKRRVILTFLQIFQVKRLESGLDFFQMKTPLYWIFLVYSFLRTCHWNGYTTQQVYKIENSCQTGPCLEVNFRRWIRNRGIYCHEYTDGDYTTFLLVYKWIDNRRINVFGISSVPKSWFEKLNQYVQLDDNTLQPDQDSP